MRPSPSRPRGPFTPTCSPSGRTRSSSSLPLGLALFLAALSLVPAPAEALHIHIIGHSHCDPGWLDTFEAYYARDVSGILNNVVQYLSDDPKKRFVWSETSFFQRWYEAQNSEVKAKVQRIVRNGQLEFVGGGWSQNDEANPDPLAIVNQMTEGHHYLLKNFGVQPRIGWQIDPFGHSSVMPSVFALMGFDAMVINRIHFSLKSEFKTQKHMEFIWKGADLGGPTNMFTHVLHTHYSAPMGFDWEEGSGMHVSPGNVRERAFDLVHKMQERQGAYRTSHLLVPWGDDFKFKNGQVQWSNMDQIVSEISRDPSGYGATISYSTLSDYFRAVYQEVNAAPSHAPISFPVYAGDFFPYADNADSYWTGFYSTRPFMKAVSRRVESISRGVEALHALVRSNPSPLHAPNRQPVEPTFWEDLSKALTVARQDAALFLHHDAITGTSRGSVVTDYMSRMNDAAAKLMRVLKVLLERALTRDPHLPPPFTPNPYVLAPSAAAKVLPLVLFNSLAWPRKELVTVRVSTAYATVLDPKGAPVPAQIDPFWSDFSSTDISQSQYHLSFVASVPPLGSATYLVSVFDSPPGAGVAEHSMTEIFSTNPQLSTFWGLRGSSSDSASSKFVKYTTVDPGASILLDNDLLRVELSPNSGLVQSITDRRTGINVPLKQKFFEYMTSRSGAYIFRPQERPREILHNRQTSVRVSKGPVLSTFTVRFHEYDIAGTLLAGSDPDLCGHFALSQSVVAAPNQELVLRFSTAFANSDELFTHNGVEFLRRKREPEPLAGNFFPAVIGARIVDSLKHHRLTVATAHSMGCGSQAGGELEFMVHRSLNQDDGRGLSQAVTDTSRIDVPLWITVDQTAPAEAAARELEFRRRSLRMNNPLLMLYAKTDDPSADFSSAEAYLKAYQTEWCPLENCAGLPADVHLFTLTARDAVSDDVLLRLQSIGYETKYSQHLEDLFSRAQGFKAAQLREVTLTANQEVPVGVYPKTRLFFPPDTDAQGNAVPTRFSSFIGALRSALGNAQSRQNTDEEGVFISQAALDRTRGDNQNLPGVGGAAERKLLSLSEEAPVPAARHLLSLPDPSAAKDPASDRLLAADVGRESLTGTVDVRSLQLRSFIVSLYSSDTPFATDSDNASRVGKWDSAPRSVPPPPPVPTPPSTPKPPPERPIQPAGAQGKIDTPPGPTIRMSSGKLDPIIPTKRDTSVAQPPNPIAPPTALRLYSTILPHAHEVDAEWEEFDGSERHRVFHLMPSAAEVSAVLLASMLVVLFFGTLLQIVSPRWFGCTPLNEPRAPPSSVALARVPSSGALPGPPSSSQSLPVSSPSRPPPPQSSPPTAGLRTLASSPPAPRPQPPPSQPSGVYSFGAPSLKDS